MSAAGGSRAIIAALAANLGIAVIKFVAFAITGSASLLAEGVHSVVDSGNQGLLLRGARSARRDATPQHPFGFGRDRYVYGFLVALMLFSAGGLFALYEGIDKIRHPHHLDSVVVAIVVLVVAIGLEGFSLRTAIHESRALKGDETWLGFIRHSKSPDLPVVLLEDVAALTGLVLALLGVGLADLTGEPVWDGIGTCAIGALLITVAIVLVIETKSLLVGEAAGPADLAKIEAGLVGPGIDRIIHLRTMHLGPDELLVGAKLAMPVGASLPEVARAIDDAEQRVRTAVPSARVMYLEPDLDRG
jgi:cation diffusion facilitator family transporter